MFFFFSSAFNRITVDICYFSGGKKGFSKCYEINLKSYLSCDETLEKEQLTNFLNKFAINYSLNSLHESENSLHATLYLYGFFSTPSLLCELFSKDDFMLEEGNSNEHCLHDSSQYWLLVNLLLTKVFSLCLVNQCLWMNEWMRAVLWIVLWNCHC